MGDSLNETLGDVLSICARGMDILLAYLSVRACRLVAEPGAAGCRSKARGGGGINDGAILTGGTLQI